MKKLSLKAISYILLSSMTLSPFAVSAGGEWYGYDAYSQLSSIEELVSEKKIKDILKENILSIMGNTISEDWEYNNMHFYTKNILLDIDVPEALLMKIKKGYIGFTSWDNFYVYDDYGYEKEKTALDIVQGKNNVRIDLDITEIPTEITLERETFDPYIDSEYGNSFVGTLFLELTDGSVIPFSNSYYIYFNADSSEGKLSQLSNMYYTLYPYDGYPDLTELLKKYFERLEARTGSIAAYITALEKIQERVAEMTTQYEEAQGKLAEAVNSEEDFVNQVETYGKIMQRYNILSDLKWRIGTEIQTRNSEGILEELFGE